MTQPTQSEIDAYHEVRDVLAIADQLAERDLAAYNNLAISTGDRTYIERGRYRLLKVKEAFGHLETIRAALATQPTCVTVDEFSERMLNEVVLDGQYSQCYGRDIARVFPNGIRIIPNKQGDGDE